MSQVLIAIVDDDEPVRDAAKALVRSLGYHASTFASADEFLKSKQVHYTSCIITDVQMTGLSGIDLWNQAKRYAPAPLAQGWRAARKRPIQGDSRQQTKQYRKWARAAPRRVGLHGRT